MMKNDAMIRHAVQMIHHIRNSEWTNEPPDWADGARYLDWYLTIDNKDSDADYTRAVQTAEAFILLFRGADPEFPETKFLQSCGLLKKGKR